MKGFRISSESYGRDAFNHIMRSSNMAINDAEEALLPNEWIYGLSAYEADIRLKYCHNLTQQIDRLFDGGITAGKYDKFLALSDAREYGYAHITDEQNALAKAADDMLFSAMDYVAKSHDGTPFLFIGGIQFENPPVKNYVQLSRNMKEQMQRQ